MLTEGGDEEGMGLSGEPSLSFRVYRCDGCNLAGSIPSEIDWTVRGVWADRFPNLEVLSIADGRMSGSLPDG